MNNKLFLIFLCLFTITHSAMAKITIVCGSSGVGKSSIIKGVRELQPHYGRITSYTTRAKRDHEVVDKDYHFISQDDFEQKKDKGYFIETAKIYDNYYGYRKEEFLQAMNSSKMYIIDMKSEKIEELLLNIKTDKAQIHKICINVADLGVLKSRIEKRDGSNSVSLPARLAMAKEEADNCSKLCDASFTNDNLEQAIKEVTLYITAL